MHLGHPLVGLAVEELAEEAHFAIEDAPHLGLRIAKLGLLFVIEHRFTENVVNFIDNRLDK